ncbi:MAG: nuclear transport factor 2 family protein [Bacteroidetes bacterium]|nr:nuclear transport factor 2 family protein [Bacteroidota bacterium]MCW5896428.1 nuclear transport factor 2 family protein [Bacteroidota bacterium]
MLALFIAIGRLNKYIFSVNNIMKAATLTHKDTLLLQNARFYEAFESADLSALDDVWSHAGSVKCIHPGWHLLEGWPAIRESWERIFRANANMKISLRNISAEIRGTLGIVTLIEEISYTTPNSIRTGSIMATNIFERVDDGWKMIHHHGSPMMVAEEEGSDNNFRYN